MTAQDFLLQISGSTQEAWTRGSESVAQKRKLVRKTSNMTYYGPGKAIQYQKEALDELVMQVVAGTEVSSSVQIVMDLEPR